MPNIFDLPVFTYIKLGLIALVLAAMGFFYVSWRTTTADLKVATAAVSQRDAQITTLVGAAEAQRELDAWLADDRKDGAAIADKADAKKKGIGAVVTNNKGKVKDAAKTERDARPSPVLVDAVTALRGLYRTEIVPACNGGEAGAPEVRDPAGAAACSAIAALIPEPEWQSDVAMVGLRFGQAYAECAVQISAIKERVDKQNARVDAFNARAAP